MTPQRVVCVRQPAPESVSSDSIEPRVQFLLPVCFQGYQTNLIAVNGTVLRGSSTEMPKALFVAAAAAVVAAQAPNCTVGVYPAAAWPVSHTRTEMM